MFALPQPSMERRKFDWRRFSAPVAIASMILAVLSVVLYFNIREHLTARDEANLPRVTVDLGYARYSGNVLPSGVSQFLVWADMPRDGSDVSNFGPR
ncbi:hypothetical protein CH063_06494 [Colletotrichum higginsianum]|uniref:Uncharacterized protein n=1 Tax=Colletotrichum higginsianum (strain IMI 349063) TaxID=759273 RepID=H1V2R4_COLHI|nr:hypothetical protein CH063_06494 [Colletotrichum higginsianum]